MKINSDVEHESKEFLFFKKEYPKYFSSEYHHTSMKNVIVDDQKDFFDLDKNIFSTNPTLLPFSEILY